MNASWRHFQSYIYVVIMAFGIALLVITVNDLLIQSTALSDAGVTLKLLGGWEYWVFAIAIVLSASFTYLFINVTRHTKKFSELVKSTSKSTFVKHLKELEKLSRELGPKYKDELQEAMDKWKVK